MWYWLNEQGNCVFRPFYPEIEQNCNETTSLSTNCPVFSGFLLWPENVWLYLGDLYWRTKLTQRCTFQLVWLDINWRFSRRIGKEQKKIHKFGWPILAWLRLRYIILGYAKILERTIKIQFTVFEGSFQAKWPYRSCKE